jgi:hypothetical protein
MRAKTVFMSLALVVLMTSLSMSQYYARESFNYPLGTSIDTLMGTSTNGWSGSWYKITASQANAAVASNTGLPYDDLSYPVPNVGNHLESVPDPTGTELRWGRNLDKTWPDVAGQTYWISFIMDVKNATDNATWLGVKFYFGASGELGMLGKGHGLDKYTVGSGWHGGPGTEVSSTPWTVGPVWLVGEVFMNGAGNYDPIYMWINPDPTGAAPDTSNKDAVTYTSGMDNGFNVIRIEFGGTVGDGLQASFDELRLGTSWKDVSSDLYFARESFEYPLGTSIDTLMGTSTNGWSGSWYKITASQANAAVASNTGLPYDDLSYPVPNVGNHLESVPDPTGTELRWGRNLDKTWPDVAGQTYWISFIMDVKNATDNATWLGVKFYFGASGELGMLGKGHGLDKYTVGSGWHGGPGTEVSSTPWTVGPVWLVGEVFMNGAGNYDPIYMWINPDPTGAAPDTSNKDAVTYTSGMDNGFNVIRIEFGGTVGDGLQASFDELRLGTSWADVSSSLGVTGVLPWQGNKLPSQFVLSQNYPNPFNPSTNIQYTLEKSGKVRLSVYDLLGREVGVLVDGVQNVGTHQVVFSRAGLSSGIYFYTLQTANGVITKKMVLLK